MAFLSGKDGSVKIGATSFAFGKWRVPLKIGLPKVTNFTSQGAQLLVTGVYAGTVIVEGPWDVGNMPFALGQSAVWLLGVSNAIALSVTGYIESIEPSDDTEDTPRVTITVQSSGPFTAAIT